MPDLTGELTGQRQVDGTAEVVHLYRSPPSLPAQRHFLASRRSGLSAYGRRYVYKNAVNMVDLGLRLADARVLGLQSEPVAVSDRDNQGGEEQRVTSGVLFSDDYGSG